MSINFKKFHGSFMNASPAAKKMQCENKKEEQ